MNWLEISIDTVTEKIDALCAELENLSVSGLVIDDEAVLKDFMKNQKKYWDYVDDELIASMAGVCRVRFYLEDSESGQSELAAFKMALPDFPMALKQVRDEDWENNWRAYYKPMEIGRRLLVVPEWELIPENHDRVVLRMDPGLIFGTGSHATTRMCLQALETYPRKSVLDIGCGSGILLIAALMLGAEKAVGCDIDEKAPHVVYDNAGLNNIQTDRFQVYAGDILSDTSLKKKIGLQQYDLILANIVADVIIDLCPQVNRYLRCNGVFICSGIIEGRQNEVKDALLNSGYRILSEKSEDDWYCYVSELSR